MKKITLPDSEKGQTKRVSRWHVWLSVCLLVLLGSTTMSYGQVEGSTCINSLAITSLPYTLAGNTSAYGDDYESADVPATAPGAIGGPSASTSYLGGDDVVFSITPTSNGFIDIVVSNLGTWSGVYAFTGCPFASTVGHSTSSVGGTKSIEQLPVVANTTYYIVISTWPTPQSTAFSINVTGTPGLLTPLEDCTGVPTGGTASLTPNGGNAGSVFVAKSTGATLATGLVYQWQKEVAGTWQDIAGATTINSSLIAESGAVGTTTNYRLAVTCTATNEVGYSTVTPFTIQLVYCTSVPTSKDNSGITNVALGSSSFAVPNQTYYNHGTTIDLLAGITNTTSITFATGYSYYTNIWIDLNDNGTFESSELLFQGESTNANPTVYNASFLMDVGAPVGIHKMRIGTADSGQATPDPCYNLSYGVTVDVMVNILPPPTCLPPSALTALAITSTSADLSWASSGSSFAIEWGVQGFTLGDGTPIANVSNPFTLTGLLPITSYSYYVRQDCSVTDDGISIWSGPYTFKTACGLVTSFTENFDAYTATGVNNPLPTCWTRFGNTGSSYITTGSAAPMSPSNKLYLSGSNTGETNGVAVMPAVSNLQAETHRLRFFAYCTTAEKSIEIGYYESSDDVDSFVPLEAYELPSTAQSSAIEFIYAPTASAIPSGITSLAFRANGGAFAGTTTIYVDNVYWEPLPACFDITTVIFTEVMANSVDVEWENGGEETAWEYVYGPSATTTSPAELVPTLITNTPYTTLTANINPSTTYNFWIRSVCDGNAAGNWSLVKTFTTPCAATPLPWSEGFEGVATVGTTAFPPCWFKQVGDWSTALVSTYNQPKSGTKYLRVNWAATNDTMWTPGFELTAGTSYDFSFYMQGDGFLGWSVDLLQSMEQNSTDATQIGETVIPNGTGTITMQQYQLVTNTFTVPADGVYYFALRVNQPSTSPWYVAFDDFKMEVTPTCVAPTIEAATNVTSTSATVSWSSPEAPANGYEYFVTTDTAIVPNASTVPTGTIAGTMSQTNLTQLNSSSVYNFYVRAVCSSSDSSSWSSAVTFTTACAPITTLPWLEGFEDITAVGVTSFPPCWFKENGDWATALASTYNTPNTGTKYIRNSWSATNEYMWTPGFELTAGTSYDFSFNMQGDGWTGWNVDVFYNSTQSSVDATQIGNTVSPSGTGSISLQSYSLINNSFVPGTTGVYYFAIRVNQASGSPWYVAFDDFKLELSPNCVQPSLEPIGVVTSATAVINWTAPFTPPANGYEYFYTTDLALVPTTATVATGSVAAGITTVTLTNLSSSTAYKYYVRSLCSSSEMSSWSSAGNLTTPCQAISTLPWNEGFEGITTVGTTAFPPCWFKENGEWATSNAVTYNTARTGTKYLRDSYAATNEYMWTPGFEMTAGISYDFSFYMQGDGYSGWDVDVFYNTVQSSVDATQLGGTTTATGPGASYVIQPYQLVNNTFVPTSTGIYYFAVRVNQPGFPWYIAFDDFKMALSPNCVTPVTAGATDVTTTTATLNWTAPFNAPASGYDYYLTTNAALPTAATTPTGTVGAGITTADVTLLTPSSLYKFYVRGVCSTTETSEWSQMGSFTTLCDTEALPYVIDFESVTIPNLPLCTSNQNVGTGNNWVTVNSPGSGFTNKTLKYGYNLTNAANTWFFTNSVNLVAGTPYTVSYKYGTNSTTTYTENLKVAYGVSASNTSMTTVLADHPGIIGTTPQNNAVNFTPAVSGTYVFGFNAYSNANQNSLFLDDIIISQNLETVTFENNKFTAYPNPVKNNLNIRYTESIKDVTVYNLLGQQVFTKNINATEGQIDMSNLASGTYLVKVTSGDKVQTMKVIKE